MEINVYKMLSKIVGVVLVIVGAAALFGANFAHGFVSAQLKEQAITMPTAEALSAQVTSGRIGQEDADVMGQYAGQPMLTGPQAAAFADHYIAKHMLASAKAAGVSPEQSTFAGLGDVVTEKTNALKEELSKMPANASLDEKAIAALAAKEIANPNTTVASAKEVSSLTTLRMSTFLNGDTLRGMLLNAYGWWTVGTVALAAGWALIVVGAALFVFGFVLRAKPAVAHAKK